MPCNFTLIRSSKPSESVNTGLHEEAVQAVNERMAENILNPCGRHELQLKEWKKGGLPYGT